MGQTRDLPPVTTYLPPRVKAWLQARADANGRTLSGEIRYVLVQVFNTDPDWPIDE